MKTVDIIERIEGEAQLKLNWKYKKIVDAQIEFLNFRGFEYILKNKPALDALVYNPRICGICGQAHLLTTAKTLENLYTQAGERIEVSFKAQILRELGLAIEIIDSHLKWFYLFVMPDVVKRSAKNYDDYTPIQGSKWLNATKVASETMKALAIYAGQWPHTSYMLPGGVMSDPTLLDMATIENYIDQCIVNFEKNIIGLDLDTYLGFEKFNDFAKIKGDLRDFRDISNETGLHAFGSGYEKYMVLSEMFGFKSGKIKNKNVYKVDLERIEESDEFTFDAEAKEQKNSKYGWAKSVSYDGCFYEVGPLSRALTSNRAFVKDIHKTLKGSVFTRVVARMDELGYLLYYCKELLKHLDINEPSYIKPKYSIKELGQQKAHAVVEACRGSLYHEIEVNNGKISHYDIITPTVWNLGPGSKEKPGTAQKSIIGLQSLEDAVLTLRSFDVCSVCTTH